MLELRHHGAFEPEMYVAGSRRRLGRLRQVAIGDVHSAGKTYFTVDDKQLAVVSQVHIKRRRYDFRRKKPGQADAS